MSSFEAGSTLGGVLKIAAEARSAGLLNIELNRPVPIPRLIERSIGSIGVITIGFRGTGDLGRVEPVPCPTGLDGTAEEGRGTTGE